MSNKLAERFGSSVACIEAPWTAIEWESPRLRNRRVRSGRGSRIAEADAVATIADGREGPVTEKLGTAARTPLGRSTMPPSTAS